METFTKAVVKPFVVPHVYVVSFTSNSFFTVILPLFQLRAISTSTLFQLSTLQSIFLTQLGFFIIIISTTFFIFPFILSAISKKLHSICARKLKVEDSQTREYNSRKKSREREIDRENIRKGEKNRDRKEERESELICQLLRIESRWESIERGR